MSKKRARIAICPDLRDKGVLGVSRTYFEAVQAQGGVAYMLPLVTEEAELKELLQDYDGLILPGGIDVDACHFGEVRQDYTDEPKPELDTMHLLAVKVASELQLPTLGICRGMQVMNIARGGTLYQDMAKDGLTETNHAVSERISEHVHTVKLLPEAKILAAYPHPDPDAIPVNTSHHQAVKVLGEGVVAGAISPDGAIEAIEFTDHDRMIGVQWHPERLHEHDAVATYLFRWLVEQAEE